MHQALQFMVLSAANGVVIITTKHGKKGKAVITYNDYFRLASRSLTKLKWLMEPNTPLLLMSYMPITAYYSCI